MNNFPHDLVFLIAKELQLLHGKDKHVTGSPAHGLAQYAVINRTWNVVIERITFRSLSVFSSEIPEHVRKRPITTARLRRMMTRDPLRRCAIPREIFFHASYKYDLDSVQAHSEAGRKENDENFSRSIRIFWKMLRNWEAVRPNEHLKVHLYYDSVEGISTEAPVDSTDETHLQLIGESLPRLRFVSSFHAHDYSLLWPPTLLEIIASLENLKHAAIDLRHARKRNSRNFFKYSQELGTTFSQIPSTCLSVDVDWANSGISIFGPREPLPDDVNIGLRRLSTRLRSIKLTNLRISPSLFWPGADEKKQHEQRHQQSQGTDGESNGDYDLSLLPSWPNLETFELSAELPKFGPACPPVDSINEIIAAVGRAARRMPKLRSMEVDVDAPRHDMWAILKVGSAAAGEANYEFSWNSESDLPVSLSTEAIRVWGLEGEGMLRDQEDGVEWRAMAVLPWLRRSSETM